MRSLIIYALQNITFLLLFSFCLLVSAGTANWVMAWCYVTLLGISQLVVFFSLGRHNADLLTERSRLKGKRDLDRALAGIMALYGPACICIISGLDRRYGWSSTCTSSYQWAALLVATFGSALTIMAMLVNSYFYSVLRLGQGHTVCTAGPYRTIRHPGYCGALVFTMATPIMLDSQWALIPTAIVVLTTIARTTIEDKNLCKRLDGYSYYATLVKYRLVPRIW